MAIDEQQPIYNGRLLERNSRLNRSMFGLHEPPSSKDLDDEKRRVHEHDQLCKRWQSIGAIDNKTKEKLNNFDRLRKSCASMRKSFRFQTLSLGDGKRRQKFELQRANTDEEEDADDGRSEEEEEEELRRRIGERNRFGDHHDDALGVGAHESPRVASLIGQIGVGAAKLLWNVAGSKVKSRSFKHEAERDALSREIRTRHGRENDATQPETVCGSFKLLGPNPNDSSNHLNAEAQYGDLSSPTNLRNNNTCFSNNLHLRQHKIKSDHEKEIEARLRRSKRRVLPSSNYVRPLADADLACQELNLDELEAIKRDNLRLTLRSQKGESILASYKDEDHDEQQQQQQKHQRQEQRGVINKDKSQVLYGEPLLCSCKSLMSEDQEICGKNGENIYEQLDAKGDHGRQVAAGCCCESLSSIDSSIERSLHFTIQPDMLKLDNNANSLSRKRSNSHPNLRNSPSNKADEKIEEDSLFLEQLAERFRKNKKQQSVQLTESSRQNSRTFGGGNVKRGEQEKGAEVEVKEAREEKDCSQKACNDFTATDLLGFNLSEKHDDHVRAFGYGQNENSDSGQEQNEAQQLDASLYLEKLCGDLTELSRKSVAKLLAKEQQYDSWKMGLAEKLEREGEKLDDCSKGLVSSRCGGGSISSSSTTTVATAKRWQFRSDNEEEAAREANELGGAKECAKRADEQASGWRLPVALVASGSTCASTVSAASSTSADHQLQRRSELASPMLREHKQLASIDNKPHVRLVGNPKDNHPWIGRQELARKRGNESKIGHNLREFPSNQGQSIVFGNKNDRNDQEQTRFNIVNEHEHNLQTNSDQHRFKGPDSSQVEAMKYRQQFCQETRRGVQSMEGDMSKDSLQLWANEQLMYERFEANNLNAGQQTPGQGENLYSSIYGETNVGPMRRYELYGGDPVPFIGQSSYAESLEENWQQQQKLAAVFQANERRLFEEQLEQQIRLERAAGNNKKATKSLFGRLKRLISTTNATANNDKITNDLKSQNINNNSRISVSCDKRVQHMAKGGTYSSEELEEQIESERKLNRRLVYLNGNSKSTQNLLNSSMRYLSSSRKSVNLVDNSKQRKKCKNGDAFGWHSDWEGGKEDEDEEEEEDEKRLHFFSNSSRTFMNGFLTLGRRAAGHNLTRKTETTTTTTTTSKTSCPNDSKGVKKFQQLGGGAAAQTVVNGRTRTTRRQFVSRLFDEETNLEEDVHQQQQQQQQQRHLEKAAESGAGAWLLPLQQVSVNRRGAPMSRKQQMGGQLPSMVNEEDTRLEGGKQSFGSADSLPSADSGLSCGNLQHYSNTERDYSPSMMNKDEQQVAKESGKMMMIATENIYTVQQGQETEAILLPANCRRTRFVGKARAKVDCNPCAYDKEALVFKRGDLINIIERSQSGIWLGECHGLIGHFKFINVNEIGELGGGGGDEMAEVPTNATTTRGRLNSTNDKRNFITKLEIKSHNLAEATRVSTTMGALGQSSKRRSLSLSEIMVNANDHQQRKQQEMGQRQRDCLESRMGDYYSTIGESLEDNCSSGMAMDKLLEGGDKENTMMSSLEQLLFAIGLADESVEKGAPLAPEETPPRGSKVVPVCGTGGQSENNGRGLAKNGDYPQRGGAAAIDSDRKQQNRQLSYLAVLNLGGITNLDSFSCLEQSEHLRQMGIINDEHQRRLLAAARIIRQALRAAKWDFLANKNNTKSEETENYRENKSVVMDCGVAEATIGHNEHAKQADQEGVTQESDQRGSPLEPNEPVACQTRNEPAEVSAPLVCSQYSTSDGGQEAEVSSSQNELSQEDQDKDVICLTNASETNGAHLSGRNEPIYVNFPSSTPAQTETTTTAEVPSNRAACSELSQNSGRPSVSNGQGNSGRLHLAEVGQQTFTRGCSLRVSKRRAANTGGKCKSNFQNTLQPINQGQQQCKITTNQPRQFGRGKVAATNNIIIASDEQLPDSHQSNSHSTCSFTAPQLANKHLLGDGSSQIWHGYSDGYFHENNNNNNNYNNNNNNINDDISINNNGMKPPGHRHLHLNRLASQTYPTTLSASYSFREGDLAASAGDYFNFEVAQQARNGYGEIYCDPKGRRQLSSKSNGLARSRNLTLEDHHEHNFLDLKSNIINSKSAYDLRLNLSHFFT